MSRNRRCRVNAREIRVASNLALAYDSILITDFDGTVTRKDFYALVAPRFLEDGLPDYWGRYFAGEITHFEAMRSIFSHIRTDEETLRAVIAEMEPEPELAACVEALRRAGWDVEIVSAGCRWYIDPILEAAGVNVRVHACPGRFDPERGLMMELPADSPYASQETGIDKAAVVRDALGRYRRVAFAGDGLPDLEAALLVEPGLRFARGWLAKELERRGERFRRFGRWAEVARALSGDGPHSGDSDRAK